MSEAMKAFDVETMIQACVPGGSICDPQVIADSLRWWFADSAASPQATAERGEILTCGETGPDVCGNCQSDSPYALCARAAAPRAAEHIGYARRDKFGNLDTCDANVDGAFPIYSGTAPQAGAALTDEQIVEKLHKFLTVKRARSITVDHVTEFARALLAARKEATDA